MVSVEPQKAANSLNGRRFFSGSANLSIRLERTIPSVVGNLTMNELVVMALACQGLKPSVLFEFGAFNGRTTLNLAANTPANAKIHTLDLIDPAAAQLEADMEDNNYHLLERTGSYFRDTVFSSKIEQHWCDSARFDDTASAGW